MLLVELTTFYETFPPVILRRRAAHVRHSIGDPQYRTAYKCLDGAKSVLAVLSHTLTRPLRLLAFNPIIQITLLIQAWSYGMIYIVLSSFAAFWSAQYGQSIELSSLHYLATRCWRDGAHRPESRVLLTFPGALLMGLGLLVYGWTAQFHVHWAAVDGTIFVYMFRNQLASMLMQAYVMDVFPEHTSSALAVSQFLRSLTAFLFPLFAPAIYTAMGYGWGNMMLALCGLVIGLPALGIIWVFGERLRQRARGSY
ncbi:caffeine resistance protein [Mycena olivaceomarginata]|nr:caffeine resistance protein [Mycena olivaceomarginata]